MLKIDKITIVILLSIRTLSSTSPVLGEWLSVLVRRILRVPELATTCWWEACARSSCGVVQVIFLFFYHHFVVSRLCYACVLQASIQARWACISVAGPNHLCVLEARITNPPGFQSFFCFCCWKGRPLRRRSTELWSKYELCLSGVLDR